MIRFEIYYDTEGSEIPAISLVNNPAHAANYFLFSDIEKEKVLKMFKFQNDEQKRIVGAAIIPDIWINRIDEDGSITGVKDEIFQVKFTRETIQQIANDFLENDSFKFNFKHKQNEFFKEIKVLESWILEDLEFDKSNMYFERGTHPIGTWFISLQVQDDAVWLRIKEEGLKGFSVELSSKLKYVTEFSSQSNNCGCSSSECCVDESEYFAALAFVELSKDQHQFATISKMEKWELYEKEDGSTGGVKPCPICESLASLGWVVYGTLPNKRQAHRSIGGREWKSNNTDCRCNILIREFNENGSIKKEYYK